MALAQKHLEAEHGGDAAAAAEADWKADLKALTERAREGLKKKYRIAPLLHKGAVRQATYDLSKAFGREMLRSSYKKEERFRELAEFGDWERENPLAEFEELNRSLGLALLLALEDESRGPAIREVAATRRQICPLDQAEEFMKKVEIEEERRHQRSLTEEIIAAQERNTQRLCRAIECCSDGFGGGKTTPPQELVNFFAQVSGLPFKPFVQSQQEVDGADSVDRTPPLNADHDMTGVDYHDVDKIADQLTRRMSRKRAGSTRPPTPMTTPASKRAKVTNIDDNHDDGVELGVDDGGEGGSRVDVVDASRNTTPDADLSIKRSYWARGFTKDLGDSTLDFLRMNPGLERRLVMTNHSLRVILVEGEVVVQISRLMGRPREWAARLLRGDEHDTIEVRHMACLADVPDVALPISDWKDLPMYSRMERHAGRCIDLVQYVLEEFFKPKDLATLVDVPEESPLSFKMRLPWSNSKVAVKQQKDATIGYCTKTVGGDRTEEVPIIATVSHLVVTQPHPVEPNSDPDLWF